MTLVRIHNYDKRIGNYYKFYHNEFCRKILKPLVSCLQMFLKSEVTPAIAQVLCTPHYVAYDAFPEPYVLEHFVRETEFLNQKLYMSHYTHINLRKILLPNFDDSMWYKSRSDVRLDKVFYTEAVELYTREGYNGPVMYSVEHETELQVLPSRARLLLENPLKEPFSIVRDTINDEATKFTTWMFS